MVNRTIHDRPVSNANAIESLVSRLKSSGTNPEVFEQAPIKIGDNTGTSIRIHFDLSGTPHEMHAVVLTRGVMVYRAHVQANMADIQRYSAIFSRAISNAELGVPKSLTEAQERAATHPRSWQPAVDLGDELYRVGRPIDAVASYQKALAKVPDQARAWLGRLRTHTYYQLPQGLEVAREALSRTEPDARVIVAAIDLLDSVGSNEEAIAALDQAWTALPGNGIVRRARIQRGLPVEP